MFTAKFFLITCFSILAKTNDINCDDLQKQIQENIVQELKVNAPCLYDMSGEMLTFVQRIQKLDDLKLIDSVLINKMFNCFNTIDSASTKTLLFNVFDFVITKYENPDNTHCFHSFDCNGYNTLKLKMDQNKDLIDLIEYYSELASYGYKSFKNLCLSRTDQCDNPERINNVFDFLHTLSDVYPEFKAQNELQELSVSKLKPRPIINFNVPTKCNVEQSYHMLWLEYLLMQFQDDSKKAEYLIGRLNSQSIRDTFKTLVESINVNGCIFKFTSFTTDQCKNLIALDQKPLNETNQFIAKFGPLIRKAFGSYNEFLVGNEISCGYDGLTSLRSIGLVRNLFQIFA